LPVVLYGCETWSLTLKEEYRLKVFKNRVKRKIFGPKRDKVAEECKRLYNEELHDLYTSPYSGHQIKNNERGGARSMYGDYEEVHTGFWCENLM
jgi:hypothetical protein